MLKLRVPHWEGGHVEDIRNIRDNLDQETVYYDYPYYGDGGDDDDDELP